MKVYGNTNIGKKRAENQDFFIADKLARTFVYAVVCDGMGGANAGNVASSTAAELIADYIKKSFSPSMSGKVVENLLKSAVISANIEVYRNSLSDISLSGMGTTVVAAISNNDTAYFVNVGDSRIYLISDGKIKQLTVDHSVVQNMVESGEITLEQAKVHPQKNIITRAIGTNENVIPDFDSISLKCGDKLLLCTDGLTNCVDDADICKIINTYGENAADKLIEIANQNGGNDNITACIIDITNLSEE